MGLIMHKGEAFGSSGDSSDLIPTNWETYRALQLAGEVDPDAYYFVDDVDVSSLLPTLINEPANNNVLVYDGTSGIWKNKMLTADDIPYDENASVEDELSSLNSAIATKVSKTKGSAGWTGSFTATLQESKLYLFMSQRYGDMAIMTVFSNGTVGVKTITGTNWSFTSANFVLTGTATNPADYAIIEVG